MPRKRDTSLISALEQDIISGLLKPGQRLEEAALARRFQVSRTPIREALLQLSSRGLVEFGTNGGAVVAQIGLKDLLDMFEVMAGLEGMCGELAARRISKTELGRMDDVIAASHRCVGNEDYDGYYACNVAFHEIIYQAARNPFLAEQTLNLRNRLAPYRRSQLHQNGRLDGSYNEHTEILNGLKAHDSEKVANLLRNHLTAQGGSLNDFIASLPQDLMNLAGNHAAP